MFAPWKKSYCHPRQHIKKQRHFLLAKVRTVKVMIFPVVMYRCESCSESWVWENWCFWTVVLEKTLSPLNFKDIKPVHPKGNQSWIFIGRTDAEALAPILWPPDLKNWLTGKDPDVGEVWSQEEKGATEDEMVGWHCRLGHEFEKALGVGDGLESLACCSPWGRREWDTTERLSWTEQINWSLDSQVALKKCTQVKNKLSNDSGEIRY